MSTISMLKAIGLFSFLPIFSELQILCQHEQLQVGEVQVLGHVLGSLETWHPSNQLHFRPELISKLASSMMKLYILLQLGEPPKT